MKTTLVLALLTVKSSYKQETELPLDNPDDVADTLQWHIGVDWAWRIKTYAIDHDIHVHKIGPSSKDMVEFAMDNNIKHYGDVIDSMHILEFDNNPEENELNMELQKSGLPGKLELFQNTYIWWSPDSKQYWSQTKPE
jgi:hypothetical protein